LVSWPAWRVADRDLTGDANMNFLGSKREIDPNNLNP
jgi:hypothetical protein